MSDETPTQKFDQAGDAPTELITGPAATPPAAGNRPSRRTVIILVIVGGALLVALLIILIVLLTRGGAGPAPTPTPTGTSTPTPTPTQTPTPTPTPTPTQTPTPPPAPPGPVINSFTIDAATVECGAPGTEDPEIVLQWSASRVDKVYFGIDTTDASVAPFFSNLPPSGDASDFPAGYYPFKYTCPAASHVYTITVVGDGTTVSKSITVTNTGYTG